MFPKIPRRVLSVPMLGLLTGIVLISNRADAQGPPIQTDTPIMLGLEGRGARTFLKVAQKGRLLREGEEISDPMDRSVTTYTTPIAVPYNIFSTFQVGAIVPFATKQLQSAGGDETSSGLGDVVLFVKKLLVQVDRRAETLRVAIRGSTKLPTGDDDAALPLGTGSFDYGLSAVAGWVKGRWGLYGEGIYSSNTSDGDVDFGDRFGYNAAIGFRAIPTLYERYPSPQLNVYVELNGNTVRRAKVDGVENPDSGGAALFLSPGIQYVGGRRWLLEASVLVPVVGEPNGTQLGTDWIASVGTRILIF